MKFKFVIGLLILASVNVHHSYASQCNEEFSNLSKTQNSFYDRYYPSMFRLFNNARGAEDLINAAITIYYPHDSQLSKIEIMRAVSDQFEHHREDAKSLSFDLSNLANRNNKDAAAFKDCLNRSGLQKCESILNEGHSNHIRIVNSSKDLADKDFVSSNEMVTQVNRIVSQLQNGQIIDYRPGLSETKAIAVTMQENFTVYREVVESSRKPQEFERKMAECLAN